MGGGIRPLDGSFADSTAFEYYQARLQPEAVFFRRFLAAEDATNSAVAGRLVSRFNHQHWLFDGNPRLNTWFDTDPSTVGRNYSIFYTSEYYLRALSEVLNCGVMHIRSGTLQWNKDRFYGEGDFDGEHVLVRGRVAYRSSGPPDHLDVRYQIGKRVADYVVRYGYGPKATPSFLPRTITNFWLSNGTPIDLDEWKILDLQISPRGMTRASFNVEPFVHGNHWPIRVYTNGAFYSRSTNGSMAFLAYLTETRKPRFHGSVQERHLKMGLVYFGWAGLNFGIFALMMRARRENTKRPTNINAKL